MSSPICAPLCKITIVTSTELLHSPIASVAKAMITFRVVIICDLATNHHCVSGRNKNDFIDWKTAGVHDYDKLDVKSSEYLSNVDVSVSLFNCTDQSCKLHEGEIDRLYGGITKSLNMAANVCIPRRKSGTRQQIAGWTEIVKEVARSDFKFWSSNDKPRHGYVYEAMRRSRSQFKYAFKRQCKRSEDTIKADRLAGDLLQHNVVDFWKKCEKPYQQQSVEQYLY